MMLRFAKSPKWHLHMKTVTELKVNLSGFKSLFIPNLPATCLLLLIILRETGTISGYLIISFPVKLQVSFDEMNFIQFCRYINFI